MKLYKYSYLKSDQHVVVSNILESTQKDDRHSEGVAWNLDDPRRLVSCYDAPATGFPPQLCYLTKGLPTTQYVDRICCFLSTISMIRSHSPSSPTLDTLRARTCNSKQLTQAAVLEDKNETKCGWEDIRKRRMRSVLEREMERGID